MRIAILSDIHGNLTALDAVSADLRDAAPDLVIHAGDLADGGSSPVEVVDRIRAMGWPGVMGNGDEMLSRPDSLEEFAHRSSAPPALWAVVREMAGFTREALGEVRLSWLGQLPIALVRAGLAVVHASPQTCWKAPPANAPDSDLDRAYGALGQPLVVFGHTHLPSIRRLTGTVKLLINCGSVGLPHDGDPRASYLLLDDGTPQIRRVAYDVEKEIQKLASCGLPSAEWVALMLRTAAPAMP
jgi:putative phosphoesterase